MPRPSSRLRQAILDGAPPCLLADIDHPDGMVHVWTGLGTLVYGGNTYLGVGILGRVTPTVFRSLRRSSARSSGGGMCSSRLPLPCGCFTSQSMNG